MKCARRSTRFGACTHKRLDILLLSAIPCKHKLQKLDASELLSDLPEPRGVLLQKIHPTSVYEYLYMSSREDMKGAAYVGSFGVQDFVVNLAVL